MIDFDTWQEILDTLHRNKLRTVLTGFAVAWGIFMLIVLLGVGQGLRHGVEYQFRDDAINSIRVSGGQTTKAYRGFQPGREIRLDNDDYREVTTRIRGIEYTSARFMIGGSQQVNYKNEWGSFTIRAVHPGHLVIERTQILEGRYINALDLAGHRKVAVIGKVIRDQLFRAEPALGKDIRINGIAFKVVGIFDDDGMEFEREMIYLPITTAQRTFNGRNKINQILYTTRDASLADSVKMVNDTRSILAANHAFDPADPRAVFFINGVENFERFAKLMSAIRLFIWVVGIGTLVAGVVGVSNIMLVTVQERTREIGIRKAIGATPGSIVGLVLKESILITAVAGYLGLVLGVAVLEIASDFLPPSAAFFRNPEVDLRTAIAATGLLVVAGTLAGYFPARRAASIQPIVALREE